MSSIQSEEAVGNYPLVSLTITAFDRPAALKACIDSFIATCIYPLDRIELVIIDNASTDQKVTDYLANFDSTAAGFHSYQRRRREVNDYPVGQKKSRVWAREIAKGEYFIDCPDDHLFVVKCNWIADGIKHISDVELADDPSAVDEHLVGSIVHYAQPLYRFAKPNNEMREHPRDARYFESLYKGYADYHIMSRRAYEVIGPYRTDLGRQCEGDYMHRSHDMGYRRNLLRYPVSVLNDPAAPHELVAPLTVGLIRKLMGPMERPLANEELVDIAVKNDIVRRIETGDVISSSDDELEAWLGS